jgi:VIT1/CCC1 family predicted Fe2+/Mn2+ transporter
VVDPPPLPARLSRPGAIAAIGSTVWALVALGLLVAWLVGARPLDLWFTTAVAGTALGGFGYGVFTWQRAAARRGSRSAQRGTG